MLFFKKSKPQNAGPAAPVQTPTPTPEGYTVELQGGSVNIWKNGKEYFDGDVIASSASGEYMLATGWRNSVESAAVFSKTDVLNVRKFEDGIAAAFVSDSGSAYICDENEHFLVLSPGSSSNKAIGFSPDSNGIILSPDVCAFAYSDGYEVSVKCFNLESGKSWSKSIEIENGSGDAILSREGNILILRTAHGEIARYELAEKGTPGNV